MSTLIHPQHYSARNEPRDQKERGDVKGDGEGPCGIDRTGWRAKNLGDVTDKHGQPTDAKSQTIDLDGWPQFISFEALCVQIPVPDGAQDVVADDEELPACSAMALEPPSAVPEPMHLEPCALIFGHLLMPGEKRRREFNASVASGLQRLTQAQPASVDDLQVVGHFGEPLWVIALEDLER